MASSTLGTGELLGLLESNECKVEDVKSLIHENLNQTKDPTLLNCLVENYTKNGCSRSLEILTGIREPHHKHLFDKLVDSLKSNSKSQALWLLSHVIRKQPSWLHHIAQHNLLIYVLKILQSDKDVPTLVSALLIIASLLPVIPSYVGQYLNSIFRIFCDLASWQCNKPVNVPEVYLLHLHAAVYCLFHKLYGMYPCNFLGYLQNHFGGNRDNLYIFLEVIKPMLESVRMHPLLITGSKESEISTKKWKKMETHDIIVDCARMSLDIVEASREDLDMPTHIISAFPSSLYNAQIHSSEIIKQFLPYSSGLKTENLPHSQGIKHFIEKGPILGNLDESGTQYILGALSTPPQQLSPGPSLVDLNTLTVSSQVSSISLLHGDSTVRSGSFSEKSDSTPTVLKSRSQVTKLSETPELSNLSQQTSLPSSPRKKDHSVVFRYPNLTSHELKSTPVQQKVQLTRSASLSEPRDTVSVRKRHETPTPILTTLCKVAQKLEEHKDLLKSDKEADQEVATIVNMSSSSHIDVSVENVEQGSPFLSTTKSLMATTTQELSSARGHSSISSSSHTPGRPEYISQLSDTSSPFLPDTLRLRSYSQGKQGIMRRKLHQMPPKLRTLQSRRSWPDLTLISLDDFSSHFEFYDNKDLVGRFNKPENYSRMFQHSKSFQQSLSNHPLFPIVNPQTAGEYCPGPSTKVGSSAARQHIFSLSPLEILDRHVLCSGELFSNTSLVSSKNTNWTHFGGKPPVDEVNILQGQVRLLHNQLLYERHIREQHGDRNRRLLGKVKRVKTLEEQNKAMQDQMKLQEKEIASLKSTVKRLQNNLAEINIKKTQEHKQYQYEIKKLTAGLVSSNQYNQQQTQRLEESLATNKTLKKDLQKVQSELFNNKQELEIIQKDVANNSQLMDEIKHMNKSLLLMGELQQRYQEKLSNFEIKHQKDDEVLGLKQACQKEVGNLKQALENKEAQWEAARSRVLDLEATLANKDKIIAEQKRILKDSNFMYEGQMKALEEKYKAQRASSSVLESHVLALYQKLETDKKISESSSRSGSSKKGKKGAEASAANKLTMPSIRIKEVEDDNKHISSKPRGSGMQASEPILINRNTKVKRKNKVYKESDEIDDDDDIELCTETGEFPAFSDLGVEQGRLSGALESTTPHSLASIVEMGFLPPSSTQDLSESSEPNTPMTDKSLEMEGI